MKYELDFQTISAPVKRMVIFHYDHKKSEDKFPFISVNLKCLYKVELFFFCLKSLPTMSKQDIIETLKQFLNPFGYDVNNKIKNQNQTVQILKLILISTEIIFSIIVAFIPMRNPFYLTLCADNGYFLLGLTFRNIVNSGIISLKFHFFLAQLHYVNDDFQWLVTSNQLFQQIDYIHIPQTTKKTIKRARQILILVFVIFIPIVVIVLIINKDLRQNTFTQPYYQWIPSTLFISLWIPYHFYSTGIFLTKLYLILKMTTWFSKQFNTEVRVILKKKPTQPMVLNVLKQFSTFYQLNQQLNAHLKYCYLLMVLFFFTYGLHIFYMGIYLELITFIRVTLCSVCINIIVILSYFSLVAGSVDVQTKLLSDYIYRLLFIEHRFHYSKCHIPVRLLKYKRFEIKNFFN